jgi:hypothetical protein
MIAALEAFGVNLVNVFGARRPCREPSVFGNHLDPADRIAVAGRGGQDLIDLLSRYNFPSLARCSAFAGASIRSYSDSPFSRVNSA